MLKWLLPAVLLALSACGKNSELEGFKDIKFGLAQQQLESLGFACEDDGQCKAATGSTEVSSVTPEQLAAANPTRGAVQFAKCATCHTIEEKGTTGIGPNLWGVVGHKIADDHSNFAFSDAMKQIGGIWDAAALDRFLADPRVFAPGTKMNFSGISDPAARADLIAYLNQNASTQMKLHVAPSATTARPSAPEFTLFGKTAEVHPSLKGGKVALIDVTVALSAGELIDLLKNEYGNSKSFDYDGFMGGRHRTTYWSFSNGTSLSVTDTISEGPMGRTGMDSTLLQYGIDPREYIRNHTSVRYLDKSGTAGLLKRAKGNAVDPSDT